MLMTRQSRARVAAYPKSRQCFAAHNVPAMSISGGPSPSTV